MSGKSWRHLSFETLPENGHRAYRTKVRTTDVASGVIKAKQPIRNAPLYNVFFLLHLTYIYCIYIYILFGCFFFTRRTETQFIFSLLAIRFPRAVARNFFRFIFIRFFFVSPAHLRDKRKKCAIYLLIAILSTYFLSRRYFSSSSSYSLRAVCYYSIVHRSLGTEKVELV